MAATTVLERLVVKITADAMQFEKTINKFESQLDKVAGNVGRIGRRMMLGITVPLALMATTAVANWAKFDKAMTQSTSIMSGVTDDVRANMEAVDNSISGRSITAADELARSYYYLASAGMSVEQSMAALPAVERFAVAGAFDMALATDLLTDSQMALGLASADTAENLANLTRVGDALALANIQSNASMQQFAEALTNDAAIAARGLGIELETTMSILNAYAAQGKKGAEAGSLLGRATRLLGGAFQENGRVFEHYGIRVVDEMSGEYRNFIDIIADMEKAFAGMTKPARAAALEQLGFAALAQKSILPLLGMSDAMREWEAEQKRAAGTTEKIATKQLAAFSNQMAVVKNRLAGVTREIGGKLAPMALQLIGVLDRGIDVWHAMSEEQKGSAVQMGVWAAGIPVALVAFGSLLRMVSFAVGGFGKLRVVWKGILFIATKMNPWVALVTTLAAGIAWAAAETDVFGSAWQSLQPAMATAWDSMVALGVTLYDIVSPALAALGVLLPVVGGALASVLAGAAKVAVQAFTLLVDAVREVIEGIRTIVDIAIPIERLNGDVDMLAGSFGGVADAMERVSMFDGAGGIANVAAIGQKAQQVEDTVPGGIDTGIPGMPLAKGGDGASLEEVNKAEAVRQRLMEQGVALTEQMLTPQERYMKQLEEINKLLGENAISEQTAQRARDQAAAERWAESIAQQNAEHDRAKQIMEGLLTPAEKYQRTIKEIQKLYNNGKGPLTRDMAKRAIDKAKADLDNESAGPATKQRTSSLRLDISDEQRNFLQRQQLGGGGDDPAKESAGHLKKIERHMNTMATQSKKQPTLNVRVRSLNGGN